MPDNALTPVTPSDDPLVRFLDRAEAIKREHGFALVLETGRAWFEEVFDGDWAKVHDRSGAQEQPLQALVERHAGRMKFIGLSTAGIRTALQAYEVDLHLPPHLQGQLAPGKLRRLSAVPFPTDRVALADQALAERWPEDKVAQAVTTFRQDNGIAGKGGPKPKAPELKRAESARRDLQAMGDPAGAKDLPLGTRIKLDQEMEELAELVAAWRKALREQ